jgi:hypothetical protein
MKTILDNCKTLFLEGLLYTETLQIVVSEGFVLDKTQSIQVGQKTIEDVRSIEKIENSSQFKIEFNFQDLINFQVINESYTSLDKNEIRDTDGFIQIVSQSQYMDFVENHHGWYKDILNNEAKLYRIWTEDEVIDVVSIKEPRIEKIKKTVPNTKL